MKIIRRWKCSNYTKHNFCNTEYVLTALPLEQRANETRRDVLC